MGRFSREKGKRGEREAAELLTQWGLEARRAVQYAGSPEGGASDLVVAGLPQLRIEVKRTETSLIHPWLAQLKLDSVGADAVNVIMHKRNGGEWIGIMPASSLEILLRAYQCMVRGRAV